MPNVKCHISKAFAIAVLVIAELAMAMPSGAQNGEARLSLSKAWGYAMGGQIQGLFSLSVSAPQDTTSVRFELDGEEMATVTQPPFSIQFNTGQYPGGQHTFSATVQTAGGRIQSNTISAVFVSAEQAGQVMQRIIVPIAVIVVLAMLVGLGGQFFLSGRGHQHPEPGTLRNYGVAGGAICPQCGRPFARHSLGLNLLAGKLERCPTCGKWSIVAAASPAALAAAEAAEVEASKPAVPELSPEEKLRRQIEESRYQ
jgi:hypothetical protein